MLRILKRSILICIAMFISTMPILGHGVRIDHTIDANSGEITVVAKFDTGEPLADGQVIIFAPSDLVTPWLTDVLDEEGQFTFLPDYSIQGFWDIQVRQAGHGGLINIEITSDMTPSEPTTSDITSDETIAPIAISDGSRIVISGDAQFQVDGNIVISATGEILGTETVSDANNGGLADGFTTGQIVIMSVSVIWGFIGTALYFSGRCKK